MQTVSLRRRSTLTGLIVLATVMLVSEAAVFALLRAALGGLEERAAVIGELSVGVPSAIEFEEGRWVETARVAPREVALAGDTAAVVAMRGTDVDRALRRLLVLEAAVLIVALTLAALLLRRAADSALAPLDDVVALAGRVARAGSRERLDPDRTDTELGRLAHAFDELLDAQQAALNRARESDERSRRFMADAAHQLRTPLAAAQTIAESLLRGPAKRDRERLLTCLVHETSRSGRLVGDLLRMAVLDRADALDRRPTELGALVAAEMDRAADLAPGLTFRLQGSRPPAARIDEVAVREALANLLDNARRHARSAVTVVTSRTGGRVILDVRDDGPGLKPGDEERAFERLVNLDGKGGTGLGLAVARSIARAHGGGLEYVAGAFRLWLPE